MDVEVTAVEDPEEGRLGQLGTDLGDSGLKPLSLKHSGMSVFSGVQRSYYGSVACLC